MNGRAGQGARREKDCPLTAHTGGVRRSCFNFTTFTLSITKRSRARPTSHGAAHAHSKHSARGVAQGTQPSSSLPTMSLAFDEYGRPFIIIRVRARSGERKKTARASRLRPALRAACPAFQPAQAGGCLLSLHTRTVRVSIHARTGTHALSHSLPSPIRSPLPTGARRQVPHLRPGRSQGQHPGLQGRLPRASVLAGAEGYGQDDAEPGRRRDHQ